MVDVSITQPSNDVTRFAESNMWSAPFDNQQFRLDLKRVSPEQGFVENFQYVYRNRQLPEGKKFYQVYTLGGLAFGYWNLITKPVTADPLDIWLNLGDLCSKRGLHVDLYTSGGKQFPKRQAWIMRTYDGLHLLAVEKLVNFPLSLDDKFFLRCYTPDWDLYGVETPANFQYESLVGPTESQLSVLRSTVESWGDQDGLTTIYVDGVKKTRLPYTSELNDDIVIEAWFDPTIFKTQSYELDTLPNFFSTRDNHRKFILHPPKDDDIQVYSFDDCDFYIGDGNGNSVYLGLNDASCVRQLTHRDYSLSQDAIALLVSNLSLSGFKPITVEVVYRKSIRTHDQVYEGSKIRYLYKLTDSGIIAAMTDVKSTVPEWTAAQLERCDTILMDRAEWSYITRESTYNALSYNGATMAFAETPSLMPFEKPSKYYDIPLVYQKYSLAIEYDKDGLFIKTNQVTGQTRYNPTHPDTHYVEFIPGIQNNEHHYKDGNNNVTIPANTNYRVFVCGWSIDDKKPDNKWVDITGKDGYTVKDNILSFTFDKVNRYGRVVFGDRIFSIEYALDNVDKSMYFNFTDTDVLGALGVHPPANIFLILNNHPLIENVDYLLSYPECYIINREFVKDSGNVLNIITDGLSTSQEGAINQSELGFVIDGCLGYNGRFNIRDDRRTRIVSYGRILMPGELSSSEDLDDLIVDHDFNGYPYSVKHIYQSLPGILLNQDFVGFDAARDFDYRVSDYLTKNVKKKNFIGENLRDKYRLHSPFLHLIIYGIKLGVLTIPEPTGDGLYTRQVLNDISSPYQWILSHDPAALGFDLHHFSIAPYATQSSITLKPKELLFITQLNEIYLNSVCGITGYFEVSNV